jgi:hypothetical protein
LQEKLESWAAVAIRRSTNMWDFRKLDDGDRWTPMGEKPTMWNEPGNVVGLPAALLAVKPLVRSESVRNRLEELVWSHFDNMFGRNPAGRHFSFDAPREVEGVEHGWYSFLPGGIGRLANARFVIDGSPKDGHYPYHPEKGNFGWTEGWIQFNTAFNISLAYLAFAETRIEAQRSGDQLVIRLEAPLSFDYEKPESGKVWVRTTNGDEESVTVVEESANSKVLVGRINLNQNAASKPGDGQLQADRGSTVEAGYGYGYLGRRVALKL